MTSSSGRQKKEDEIIRTAENCITRVLLVAFGLFYSACTGPDTQVPDQSDEEGRRPVVSFKHEPNVLHVYVGEKHFGDYIYSDPVISRPFFAHVKTPAGIQVTRNHPPDPEKDSTDHETMHPGIWMSFGDINGNDYWRLKAKVKHERFLEPPEGGPGTGSFAVRNFYWNQEDSDRIGSEEARFRVIVEPDAYLLLWESTFAPYGETDELVFGDQEEFGLGIRVQTRLAEQFGGVITDSEGRKSAEQIWSKQADWIDYSGMLEGKWIGMTIMPDPGNFRPSWYHARDYGLIVANAFGREAMQAGPKSEVAVRPGEELTLRYGVWIHSNNTKADLDIPAAYARFLERIGDTDSE